MAEKISLSQRPNMTEEEQACVNLTQWLIDSHRVTSNKLYAEVELTVNGRVVSFVEMCNAFAHYDETRLRQKAVEMLASDEALQGLHRELVKARLAIKAAVDKLPTVKEPA